MRLPRSTSDSSPNMHAGVFQFWYVFILIGGLVLLLSLTRLIPQTREWYFRQHLRNGVTAQATITALIDNTRKSETIASGYYVAYTFEAPGAEGRVSFSREQPVRRATFYKLKVGDALPVIYDPANPALSTIAGEPVDVSGSAIGMCLFFFGAVSLGLGAGTYWLAVNPQRMEQALKRQQQAIDRN